jgi:hypothetical protein
VATLLRDTPRRSEPRRHAEAQPPRCRAVEAVVADSAYPDRAAWADHFVRARAGDIGSALVRAVLAEADRRGESLVVLEGSPRYYGRLGFESAPDHGIRLDLPEWAPREAAQVFPLTAHDPPITGRIEYPPAIAAASH